MKRQKDSMESSAVPEGTDSNVDDSVSADNIPEQSSE